MRLAAGTRLGPYEIESALGAGGMGEVYRAHDGRLGRQVAIKVLPAHIAGDPDAVARFERETRAVAALSHPNILAIYDVGSHDGVVYAVMELLAGETLRERLAGAPMAWRKAVAIAIQMANGLAAAHGRKIVHRDLKPENIFLTTSGPVKILDFGLARELEPVDAARTRAAVTTPGMVMGTVGYMAPEQVRGGEAYATSDIFAFGCVLAEMLTGRGPFARPTATETLAAILRDDPPAIADQVIDVPRELERIVARCLEKQPEDRFQSARDLAFALEFAGGTTGVLSAAQPPAPLPADARASSRRRRWMLPAASLCTLLLGGVIGFVAAPRGSVDGAASYVPLTFRRGNVSSARFAPDGQTVAFSASWDGEPYQVFVKRPESPDASPTGPPQAHLAAVSRSGELALRTGSEVVGPFTNRGLLASLPLVGGAPRALKEAVVAADWAPDGRGLATVIDLGDRQRLEVPGGASYETSGWISDLRYSPKSNLLAFIEHPARDYESGVLVVYDPARADKRLLPNAAVDRRELLGVAWRPDGKEIWFGELRVLRAVTLDGRERVVTELPDSVHLHDIAPDGRVLLAQESRRMQVAGRASDADHERDLSWLTWSLSLAIARDGRTVVFTEFMHHPPYQTVAALRGVDGSPVVQLGEGLATDMSPDGRWVLASRGLQRRQLVLLPTGAGEPRTLSPGGVTVEGVPKFTPDSQRVVFAGRQAGLGVRLYVQPLAGGEPTPISGEGIGLGLISVSPDGALVVANGKDGRPWLFPMAGGDSRPVAGGQPGDFAGGWTVDGSGVYLARIGVPVPLRVINVRDGSVRVRRVLSPSDPAGVMWIAPVCVSADERGYAYTYFRVLSGLYVGTGLR